MFASNRAGTIVHTEETQPTWDEDVDKVAHRKQRSCGVKEVHIQKGHKGNPEGAGSKTAEVKCRPCVVYFRLGHHMFEI